MCTIQHNAADFFIFPANFLNDFFGLKRKFLFSIFNNEKKLKRDVMDQLLAQMSRFYI